MPKYPGAERFVPDSRNLSILGKAVQQCQGCDLYLHASQAVFGEGIHAARVLLIGEQPGNDEDQQGLPFVGPAGKLLDRALQDAGFDRSEVYVTNAVKHFRFEERGKRRIHKKPSASQVKACLPWLDAEIESVTPKVIVCLGATAAQALLGTQFRVTEQRGIPMSFDTYSVLATTHPSAILRAPDSAQRREEYAHLVADLKKARSLV